MENQSLDMMGFLVDNDLVDYYFANRYTQILRKASEGIFDDELDPDAYFASSCESFLKTLGY